VEARLGVWKGKDLEKVFHAADLRGARFERCDLSGTQFSKAQMEGTQLSDCALESVGGAESKQGVTVASRDALALAYTLASAFGIRIDD
jgi:uncharacterized protein YjbI with pentapeptide repeats